MQRDQREQLLALWLNSLHTPRKVQLPVAKTTLLGTKQEGTPYELQPQSGRATIVLGNLLRFIEGAVGFGAKFGQANISLGDLLSSSSGQALVKGSSNITLDNLLLSTAGAADRFGLANITFGNVVLSGTGSQLPVPPPGYVFVITSLGEYVVDTDGYYLIEAA